MAEELDRRIWNYTSPPIREEWDYTLVAVRENGRFLWEIHRSRLIWGLISINEVMTDFSVQESGYQPVFSKLGKDTSIQFDLAPKALNIILMLQAAEQG